MIETRESEKIIRNCAGCSYCNTICPTQSNPTELRKEIKLRKNLLERAGSLLLISEELPLNLMSIGLELETDSKMEKT
ncbi:MAG: hypothetical protein ACTSSA_10015 [Candidatus Freyarchaeota archaeon]